MQIRLENIRYITFLQMKIISNSFAKWQGFLFRVAVNGFIQVSSGNQVKTIMCLYFHEIFITKEKEQKKSRVLKLYALDQQRSISKICFLIK